MFDWNDEDLRSIIWDEAGASDDHIVPFPDSKESCLKKKEWVQGSSSRSSGEQKAPAQSSDIGVKFNEGASSSGALISAWPNMSSSNTTNSNGHYIGKDHDELADYQWDGSFDDLDQILSNDDLIFGNANLGNTEELWSSSKEVNDSSVKSLAGSQSLDIESLRNASEQFDIKEEYLHEDDHDFTLDFEKETDLRKNIATEMTSHLAYPDFEENTINDSPVECQESQESHQNSIVERYEKNEAALRDHVNWCSSEPLFYHPTYGNVATAPYTNAATHVKTSENQPLRSVYENSVDNAKPVINVKDSNTLTPQEKIEKLRKRQQMQAMLAIQKQQLQFGSLEGDDLSSFTGEQGHSMAAHEVSAEDAVLFNLQDVVAKLDIRVRICIRDSLYRLAQSATQRHFTNDSSSTNNICTDDNSTLKEETHGRNMKLAEVETESNPIDRTVAHLLFHRPIELSCKRTEGTESFQSEHKVAKSPLVSSPRSVKDRKVFPVEGPRTASLLSDTKLFDHGNFGFCIDIAKDASNHADGDARDSQLSRP